MSATTGAAAPAAPGASSFNWLTQLRQHYLAGKHCDVSIKISLPAQPPPAKRAQSGRRKKKNDGEERSQEENDEEVITIPCHANILCSRSPYFDACLIGNYVKTEEGSGDFVGGQGSGGRFQAPPEAKLRRVLSCG